MPQPTAKITARQINATTGAIDIQGDLSSFAENALMDAYTQVANPTTRVIILNFTALDYMNSSGIGLLVTLLIRVNRQGQRLFAYGLSDHYRRIFELTRLNEDITIYPDEVSALAAATS